MSNKHFDPKKYLDCLDEFLKGVETRPMIKQRITHQSRLIDLFRFWYMDAREQEIMDSETKKDDRWGLGDILDND